MNIWDILILIIVAGTAIYAFRKRKTSSGCHSDCGSCAAGCSSCGKCKPKKDQG